MHIQPADLEHALRAATQIANEYRTICPDAENSERSIDWLHETVQRHLGVRIRMLELHLDKTPNTTVYGACVLKEDGNFDVLYVRGLNNCWRRFVQCKELFHGVIDKPEYRDMNIAAHVEAVTVAFPDDESQPTPATAAEFLAEVAAMEFLFPFAHRHKLLQAGSVDALDVATRFRIPRVYVELFLSNNFMENLAPAMDRLKP